MLKGDNTKGSKHYKVGSRPGANRKESNNANAL